MNKKLTIVCLFVLTSFFLYLRSNPVEVQTNVSQVCEAESLRMSASLLQWNHTFGDIWPDRVCSIIQTGDGGYAIAGWTVPHGRSNVWLFKLDQYGNVEWSKTYSRTHGQGHPRCAIQTSDGGYLLAGAINVGDVDAWLIKTDEFGNTTWNRVYGNSGYDDAFSVVEVEDERYVFGGCTGSRDIWLVEIDRNGTLLWSKSYTGNSSLLFAFSLIQTNDGGFVLVGEENDFDILLIKTDEYGEVGWNQTIRYELALVKSAIATSDGGYALCGYTEDSPQKAWVIKTNNTGNVLWDEEYPYDPRKSAGALSIIQCEDGGYAIAGWMHPKDADDSDLWLLKLTEYGGIAWSRTYMDPAVWEVHTSSEVIQTNDGGFLLACDTGTWPNYDVLVVKTDERGVVPEFPSFLILPLFMIATLMVAIVYKRKRLAVPKRIE